MSTTNDTLINLQSVTKIFFTDELETHALDAVDLTIKKGEYLAIAGPSGCGKSTLLAILGLLDSPTEGNYSLNGQAVASLKLSDRSRIRNREIGFIFQAFNLIGDLTVYENVELPLTYRGMASSERKEKVQSRPRTRPDGAPREALSRAAFRWSAATRRGGTCARRRSHDSARR